nr:MAG TPA: hypothetical protein [Caudoviricetes sp.]
MNCAKTKTVLLLTRSSNASYIGMKLGNLGGFDSLYRIRTGIRGLLTFIFFISCYRPVPIAGQY